MNTKKTVEESGGLTALPTTGTLHRFVRTDEQVESQTRKVELLSIDTLDKLLRRFHKNTGHVISPVNLNAGWLCAATRSGGFVAAVFGGRVRIATYMTADGGLEATLTEELAQRLLLEKAW